MRTIQTIILEIPGAKLNGKKTSGKKVPKIWLYLARLSSFCILRVVPHLSSGIVEGAKRERAWNHPTRERWDAVGCRVSPFLAWGDFHARSRFAPSTIHEDKWGTSRSLSFWKFWKTFFVSLLEVVKNSNPTFWLNRKRPIFRFFFFKKKNVLDRCNKAIYMIPFVMNERSVDCVTKATWTKSRQLFTFSKVVP